MNQVRIIGGVWRRRILRFPKHLALRPTPDRVRETLFNWLGQDLTGLNCLDLFAGSGALGFEAASRGAKTVTLVECAGPTYQALKWNLAQFGASQQVRLVRQNALEFIRTVAANQPEVEMACPAQYKELSDPCSKVDLLFLDPPYHQGWLSRLEPFLDTLLKADAQIYVEAEQEISSLGRWKVDKSARAGQVYYHLLCSS